MCDGKRILSFPVFASAVVLAGSYCLSVSAPNFSSLLPYFYS